jgi:hypothetical protein
MPKILKTLPSLFSSFLIIFLFSFVYVSQAAVTGTLLPISDGTYTSFTPTTGPSHYAMVDESVCNGTTDYNLESTIGSRDSYNLDLTAVPDGSLITGINITPCASASAASGTTTKGAVFNRINGVNSANGSAFTFGASTTPSNLGTWIFNGLSVTKSAGTTVEIGAVYVTGNRGMRLSRLAATITYLISPTAPSNAVATNVSSTQNDLSWTDNASTETGFKIERAMLSSASGPLGSWSQIGTAPANAVIYHDTTASADETYYYRVRSYNAAGESSYATSDYVITATNVPADPTNLTGQTVGSDVLLNWSDLTSTNEDGFSIERGTDGINFNEVYTTALNELTKTDLSLSSGSTYYYRVRAFNAIGYSGYTGVVTAPF